ncbi:MAG: hypothetical protein Q8N22_02100 [bacterium]|nr:hypothetical protein [bacterium]
MKSLFFKKIILTITISSLIFGGLGNVFTPKAAAQAGASTPGEAVGQAIGAGVSCFLGIQLENFVAGLASKIIHKVEDVTELATSVLMLTVPTTVVNLPSEISKQQTSDALMKSKNCVRDVVAKMILDWLVDETVNWIQGGGQPRYVTNWDTFLGDAFNTGVGEVINNSNLNFLCKPFGLQVRISLLPVQRFQNRISCTLDDIVANIQNFYDDFRNGSWIAYEQSWWPENNYYGSLYMTMDEAMIQGAKAKEAAQNEAIAGKGFLSVKRCLASTQLPDGTIKCIKEEIVTPGDTVGALAAQAVTSDYQWAQNIQSWVAALVNATINRLFTEGLSLMKPSTTPQSSASGNYNPYGNYDPALLAKRQERDRIKSDYQAFLAYFNAILANKKSSLSSEQQIVTNLNALKTRNCQPPVSDSDITSAQNEITRLTNEVANYQIIVNENQAGITEAVNISADFRDREMALLTQHYNDFLTKYQSLILEIAPGPETTKKASEDESKNKQAELSSIQSRLSLCIVTTP